MAISMGELRSASTEAKRSPSSTLGFALLVLAAAGCGAGLYHLATAYGPADAPIVQRVTHVAKGLLGIQGRLSPAAARAQFAVVAETPAERLPAIAEAEPAAPAPPRPSHAERRF